jgi:hypothetical protein
MKRLLQICLILFALTTRAQSDREKLELLRVNFITERIHLSTAESARFWPVYNEYNDKIRELRRNLRLSYRFNGEPSSQEAEDVYQKEMAARQAEADIHRTYANRIKQIIGVTRFVMLRQAEEEFKRQMLKAIE